MPALPNEPQRHGSTAAATQSGDDDDQTQSAQEPSAATLAKQCLAVEGRSAAQHGSTPSQGDDAASAALPDPPPVLELVIGDEVGCPAAFHRAWQVSPAAVSVHADLQKLHSLNVTGTLTSACMDLAATSTLLRCRAPSELAGIWS